MPGCILSQTPVRFNVLRHVYGPIFEPNFGSGKEAQNEGSQIAAYQAAQFPRFWAPTMVWALAETVGAVQKSVLDVVRNVTQRSALT